MVSTRTPLTNRKCISRLLCLERHARTLQGRANNFPGLRAVQLVVGSGGQGLLLPPLLFSSARSELRQSGSRPRNSTSDLVLAGSRRRRPPARRGSLPLQARRDELRESARNPRIPA